MRLRGKVALLTGAAAAVKGELMGFGGAAAHLFVREGAKVVLTDIRDELGERAAASLRAELIKCAFAFFATAALAVIGLR